MDRPDKGQDAPDEDDDNLGLGIRRPNGLLGIVQRPIQKVDVVFVWHVHQGARTAQGSMGVQRRHHPELLEQGHDLLAKAHRILIKGEKD